MNEHLYIAHKKTSTQSVFTVPKQAPTTGTCTMMRSGKMLMFIVAVCSEQGFPEGGGVVEGASLHEHLDRLHSGQPAQEAGPERPTAVPTAVLVSIVQWSCVGCLPPSPFPIPQSHVHRQTDRHHTHTHTHMHTHMHRHTHAQTHTHTCTDTQTDMHRHRHTHAQTHTCTDIDTHMHRHRHTHAQT